MPVSGCPFSRAGITDPGYSGSLPDFYLDKLARLWGHFTLMKTTIRLFTRLVLFLCLLAAWPKAQAVVPSPDGGYPNFTTAEGQKALFSLTTGAANTAVGWSALFTNAAGNFNTATGAGALLLNNADDNTAFGAAALLFNATGTSNTAVGAFALENNDSGSSNTANGALALEANTIGNVNTAVGTGALSSNTSGSGNTALGFFACSDVTTANSVTCIGSDAFGADVTNTTWISGVYNVTTQSPTTLPVVVSNDGQLGTTPSSRRFKKDIKPMDSASKAILALKPVTFHYKSDKTNTAQFGLVAEEVAEVNPDMVVRDKGGEIYSVRYDAVNAMLLNEFLKEHKKVENLEATVAQQRKGMDVLTAQLKEQAAQIQKVSDQIGISRSVPQTVVNSQ
jgi:hypothetical protein